MLSKLRSNLARRHWLLCILAVIGAWITTEHHAFASSTTTALVLTAGGVPASSVPPQTVITLTATVTAGGVPVSIGQVNFCDATAPPCTDVNLLGTAQLTTAGSAILRFVPGLGTHNYQAIFAGNTNDTGSTSPTQTLSVVTTSPTSTTVITSSGVPGDYTLTASVTGSTQPPPTGTISFLDTDNANYVLGTANLTLSATSLILAPGATYPTGQLPSRTVTADFNGDGILDLAITAFNSLGTYVPGSVYIFLGKGDGTFTAAPTLVTDIFPSALVTADFNGDGKLDLAFTDGTDGGISIFLGNGDGTFAQGTTISGSFADNGDLAVGDFNGDGIEDLVVSETMSKAIRVLLGRGDGTFTEVPSHPATGDNPLGMAVGDFNRDGHLDLAVCNVFPQPGIEAPSSVTILLGNGDGTFTPAPSVQVGIAPEQVLSADFNGDGKLVRAVLNTGLPTTISMLLGSGDGTFTAPAPAIPASYFVSIALADFNGDHKPDIGGFLEVYQPDNVDQNVYALLNNGDATFTPITAIDPHIPNTGIAGDFNGDGLSDLAVTGEYGDVSIYLTTPIGPSTATVTNISPVGTGIHYVDASYPGDTNNPPSLSGLTPLVAERVPTTLVLTANPSSNITSGQPVTLTAALSPHTAQNHEATGTIPFSSNGTALGTSNVANGSATLNTSALTAGSDSLLAQYPGDTNFEPSSATDSITASSGVPAITLTSSLNPAPALTPITFTAQVPAGTGGTIVFALNGQSITTTPNSAGTSTTTISTLTPGSYPVTATWFAPNSALTAQASLTQVITAAAAAPDFSLTGPDITFHVLQPGTGTLTLASLNGFTGSVAITCNTPYPPNYTCTLQQPTVALAPASSSVITYTLTPTFTASTHPTTHSTRIMVASLFPLTLLSLLGLSRKRRTPLRALLSLTLLAILATATTACGPDHFIAIHPGTFPLQFTATGTNQGSSTPITHTLILKLILTP